MAERLGNYESYLSLEVLFACQRPRTNEAQTSVWAAERFFIICHQASELLISQLLEDLRAAAALIVAQPARRREVADLVGRAAGIMLSLCRLIELLGAHISRCDFLNFRGEIEGISAMESPRFRQPLEIIAGKQAEVRAIRRQLLISNGAYQDDCSLAESLEILFEGCQCWRHLHLQLAVKLIADSAGTGGTDGASYLRRQIERDAIRAETFWPPEIVWRGHASGWQAGAARRVGPPTVATLEHRLKQALTHERELAVSESGG